jgi:dipeptidyl aminopeptidase/acylaminoacyl peptidase
VDPATGEGATVAMRVGPNWTPESASLDRKVLVFSVESPTEPASYYLLRNGQLTELAKTYPDIDPRALGKASLVYYKARDGLDIPAFLHTPSTELCGAGPWKTVVHPHGGPWARDALGFDYSMWIPLLTSRCAAVLQPQYRGSEGWGRRLWTAGDREWGQKMQDDKDDGVKWLIEQKIAIPGRVAMFGFSYGGYASMAAAVRPNGLYKCAIAGAGVSDIDRIWAKYYTNRYFRDGQSGTVKGLSPLSKADQIQIPIYVYHGDRDQIVPLQQSEWFVSKARGAGKDVTWREFKDYAHGPAWTRATMADQLRGIEQYLATGCGGGGL